MSKMIGNNVELTHKLQERSAQAPLYTEQIDRIGHASLAMNNLTEMLLWLSRESCDALPCESWI